MIYVTSDLHGYPFEEFQKLLDTVGFSDADLLFVLGDVIDRGEDGVRTLRTLSSVLSEKGIHAWTDFWGYDVNHDWPWWKKQIRYFLPYLLGEKKVPVNT